MRKSVLIVFTAFFIIPLGLLANTSSLFSDKAPVQSYHAQGANNVKSSQVSKTSDKNQGVKESNDAAAMAKVKEIMQAAKEEQENHPNSKAKKENTAAPESKKPITQNKSAPQEGNNNPTAIFVPQKPLNLKSGSALSQATQNNALFENQTQQKIDTLMARNSALEQRIEKLKEAMILLNQEVNQMNTQLVSTVTKLNTLSQQAIQSAKPKTKAKATFLSEAKTYFDNWFDIAIFGIGLVLVILIIALLFALGKRKPKKTTSNTQSEPSIGQEDLEGDYDFMNSEQAIPAKLDLARSYLAMEDYASARKVLQEILHLGTESQRQTAEAMLEEIPSQS